MSAKFIEFVQLDGKKFFHLAKRHAGARLLPVLCDAITDREEMDYNEMRSSVLPKTNIIETIAALRGERVSRYLQSKGHTAGSVKRYKGNKQVMADMITMPPTEEIRVEGAGGAVHTMCV